MFRDGWSSERMFTDFSELQALVNDFLYRGGAMTVNNEWVMVHAFIFPSSTYSSPCS